MSQVKAVANALLRLPLAAACAAGLVGAAWAAAPLQAAETPAPTAAPRAPAAAPGAPATAAAPVSKPKDIWEETPYQMYAQSGRVDPFTRGKPKTIVTPKRTFEGVEKAVQAYDEAEALLISEKENRYDVCKTTCDKGMQDLRQTILEISKNEELAREMERARELMERFVRLEATARRLKQRQIIEADFAKLKITVDGIVWTEQSPSAAISGKVCSEGSLLTTGATGQDFVQVHRIRRDAVVFLYRGVQISLRLDRGGR